MLSRRGFLSASAAVLSLGGLFKFGLTPATAAPKAGRLPVFDEIDGYFAKLPSDEEMLCYEATCPHPLFLVAYKRVVAEQASYLLEDVDPEHMNWALGYLESAQAKSATVLIEEPTFSKKEIEFHTGWLEHFRSQYCFNLSAFVEDWDRFKENVKEFNWKKV